MALFLPAKSPRLTSSPDSKRSVKSGAKFPTPTLPFVRRKPTVSSPNQMSIFY